MSTFDSIDPSRPVRRNAAVKTQGTCDRRLLSAGAAALVWLGLCLQGTMVRGDDASVDPEHLKLFETKIRPVLVEHCYRCHASEGNAIRGGLMVDSREGLLGGGESGPAIVPGDLDGSLLWNAINHEDFQMPPDRKLPASVLEDFRQWILLGAPDPRTTDISAIQTKVTPEVIEAGKSFWAFQPPRLSQPPALEDSRWVQNEIDPWVLAGIESQGLRVAEDASPEVLVRRLYFDLIGLPPTPRQIDAFVRDFKEDSQRALDATIDSLLESPHYGERWGRHWLDVVRYAESSGKEIDLSFPHAWRYRDFVIDSFNADKPYDHFLRQQIAGDLLPIESDAQWAENLVATGFLAIGPKTLTERNPRQFSADLIDEQIDVTTRVVLGLSVACARCHDHKFDPIGQEDYYALAGIFQSTEAFFGGIPTPRLQQRSNLLLLPVDDPGPQRNPLDSRDLAALKERIEATEKELAEAQRELRAGALNSSLRPQARQGERGKSEPPTPRDALQARQRVQAIERRLATLKVEAYQYDEKGQLQSFCMGVQDRERPVDARLLVRGEINQPGPTIARGFVRVLSGPASPMPATGSGRLQLARWMTHPDHPLTARVMVNRIWMHMIGQPIVAETDNFGASGAPPTHPELLDALAIEFVREGWSIKSLIGKIARSRTYRMSTKASEEARLQDPENRWLSHAHPRRLEAEALRDAMLAISGQLDLRRPRGSEVARMGTTILQAGASQLENSNPSYRSVYLPISRSTLPHSLEVFDFPEPSMVVGQREVSSTASQSLFLMNSPFVIEQSEVLARRLNESGKSPREWIDEAFRLVYGRSPTPDQLQESLRFLREARADQNSPDDPAPTRPLDQRGAGREFFPRVANRFANAPNRNRGGFANSANRAPATLEPLAQFCQALFVSAEFRYLR